jgi:hypothetical protein
VPFEIDLSARASSAYMVPFSGQGRQLATPGSSGASDAPAPRAVNADQRDGTADFLSRLPETVIHHGRVVSVRAGIADFIKVRIAHVSHSAHSNSVRAGRAGSGAGHHHCIDPYH